MVDETPQTPVQEKPGEDAISKAEALKQKLDDVAKRTEELIAKAEQIHARDILSGRSSAGSAPEQVKKESPKEYAQRILRGGI